MNLFSWLALTSYLMAFAIVLVFAIAYLKRSEFMPYHRIAVGQSWDEVDSRMQVLLLALIRIAGSAWLALVLASVFLLHLLFSDVRAWWEWLAFQVFCLIAVIPPVAVAAYVRRRTAAPTPVRIGSVAVVLCLLGFVFAVLSGRYA